MEELIIEIIDCPTNSYKLRADGIRAYYDEALVNANEFYLHFFEEVYEKLMFNDFNILWTPDTLSTNDIDPKDGFWAMEYFFFNTELISLLSDKYKITIVDNTSQEFRNQEELYKFIRSHGIRFSINKRKDESKTFKNSLKKLVKGSLRNFFTGLMNILQFLKKEYSERYADPQDLFRNDTKKKIIYLTIPPIGGMSIKDYLQWRYSSLFKQLKYHEERGNKVVLVSTKNFIDSDKFDYPLINTFWLLTKGERLKIAVTSLFLKVRTKLFIWLELMRPGNTSLEKYFIKNIPTKLYYAYKEHVAFDKLFKTYGSGLLIMKGPIVYKGACIHNYNARKYGVRVLSIAGRVLTSTRLTNCFLNLHRDGRFPAVLPHSMMLSDKISTESIRKQSEDIDIHPVETAQKTISENGSVHKPFTITLALQKRNEMEDMIDTVISSIRGMENIVLKLKLHPDFPMHPSLERKYGKNTFVNILPIETSLSDTVEMSDICITAYSTSAFEFARKMKPIVWINYVTLNSLFFTDVRKKVGLTVNDEDDLKDIIKRMKTDEVFYNEQRKSHYSQLKDVIYESGEYIYDSFNSIINKELKKI